MENHTTGPGNNALIWQRHAERITAWTMAASQAEIFWRQALDSELFDDDGPVHSFDGHPGASPERIDAFAAELIKAQLQELGLRYISEESRETFIPKDREVVALVDEVDGTKNDLTHGLGAATALSFWRYSNRRRSWKEIAGAITTTDLRQVSWTSSRVDTARWRDPLPTDTRLNSSQILDLISQSGATLPASTPVEGLAVGWPDRVAAVAAPPERASAMAAFDLSGLWYYTMGGNPMVHGLVLGNLAAVIEPHDVHLWDAMFLRPLHILGGVVVAQDGTPSPPPHEVDDLRRLSAPYIAATTPDVAKALLARRRAGRRTA